MEECERRAWLEEKEEHARQIIEKGEPLTTSYPL